MSATLTPEMAVSEATDVLTMAEIEQKYNGEWVIILDPDLDEHLNVLRGRVVAHGPDREEVYKYDGLPKPFHAAFLYIGDLDPDMAYMF